MKLYTRPFGCRVLECGSQRRFASRMLSETAALKSSGSCLVTFGRPERKLETDHTGHMIWSQKATFNTIQGQVPVWIVNYLQQGFAAATKPRCVALISKDLHRCPKLQQVVLAQPMDLPLHANAPVPRPLTFRYPQCNHLV